MSASSPVALCNRALTLLGGNTITSFDDGTNEAKLCNIHYTQVRDSVTSAIEWTFATMRAGPLAPSPQAPLFEFSFQYTLPPDLMLLLSASDKRGGVELLKYVMEGGKLLADVGSGVYIRYNSRVVDTTKFVQPYTEALVARMAAELAIPLTESRTLQGQFFKIYQAKLDEAAAVDNLQGRNIQTRTVRHQRARWSGGYPGFNTAGG